MKYLPNAVIFLTVLVLGVVNFTPGTYLTGWDNLHPEFNFLLNIKRSLFAVWQEYQGLGLLGGMGHAADLPRQIFLYILSIFMPDMYVRYFWTMLTLFLGGLGAYFCSKYGFNFSPVAKSFSGLISKISAYFIFFFFINL